MQRTAQTQRDALERVLSEVRGEPLVILISGHPDPDAIGAALAHQRICESLGVGATIAHVHPLSHRENRALVKLLHVDLVQVSTRADLARFKYLSLVDTTAPEATVELPAELKLLTVVDHHRPIAPIDAPFVDLRTDLGATCTAYAEYMQHGLVPLTGDRREDVRVATALVFGIQTDTDDFTLASPDDFRAAAYAKTFCDADLLARVGRRFIGAAAMDVLGRALADLTVVRDFGMAGVGHVSPGDRDAIGAAADFILRREDIDTVLVFGIVDDRIDGSLRTRSPSVDPASFLQTAFGKDHNGRPYGGGRADKGGFQIPLGVLADSDDPEGLWRIVSRSVISRIARVVPDVDPHHHPQQPRRHIENAGGKA
jgi:nanoRNase/pAp phosphatase (c-di-AMP/oligoRNAs hydrolase)